MNRQQKHYIKIAAGILIFALFLITRLYRLPEIPRGIHVDEAGMAFDAFCLSHYGTDRYGLSRPVYLANYGGGQSALYAYLAAAAIRLLHFSPTVFRLPAVFGGFLTLLFGSLILKRTLGTKAALTGALLLTVCPYFLMASRWGLDCNLMLGFTVMSLYLLMAAVSSGRKSFYALAGFSFGIALYSYAIAFIALPLFLFPALLLLLRHKKITVPQIISFGLPLALLAAPLMLMIAFHSGILTPFSTPGFTVPVLPEYRGGELSLSHFAENLNLFYILFSHDPLIYNGFAAYGTLYYLSVPFFAAGIAKELYAVWHLLRKKEYNDRILVLLWFFVLLLTGLSMSLPNINRLNAIYFPLLYYTTEGLLLCAGTFRRLAGKWGAHIFSAGAAGLYLLLFLSFARYYYQVYPQQLYPQRYFNDAFISILDYIEDEKFPGQNREIYVDPYEDENIAEPYIYTLLRHPGNWELWLSERQWDNSYGHYHFNVPDDAINPDGVYIMYSNGIAMAALEQAGFTWEPYELWKIYWKPQ